jgi:anti-sigma factor RsiW
MSCTVEPVVLLAYLDGELADDERPRLEAHLQHCAECAGRLAQLRRSGQALQEEAHADLPDAVRRRLGRTLGGAAAPDAWPEVMALEEVARYLGITLDELDRLAADLPAFEVAGRIRVRRSELGKWIARREQDYAAQRLRTETTRGLAHSAG